MNPNIAMAARVYPEQNHPLPPSPARQYSRTISIEMTEERGPDSSPRRPDENSPSRTPRLSNSPKQSEEGSSKKLYVKQVTGRHNDTDLHLAVKNGELEGVKDLLSACDDAASLVCEVNELGETPLHVAADRGHLEVLKELLKYVHPDTLVKKNQTGFDAFHVAAKQGHLAGIRLFGARECVAIYFDFPWT
ncbi:hypothetical protein KI387_010449, partial [Taxus chinensis]